MTEVRLSDESDERGKRCLSIIHRLQNLRNEWHLPSVRSLFGGPVDGSRSTEWRQDVEHALRVASKRSGLNPYKEQVIIELLSRQISPNHGWFSAWVEARDYFLSEMDNLNRLGTPDDYKDDWGFEAYWRRVEARRREGADNLHSISAAREMTA